MTRITLLCMILAAASLAPAAETPAKLPAVEVGIPTSLQTIKLVKIPAGTFDFKPAGKDAQKVEIKSFYLATTELTWDAFDPWLMRRDLTIQERAKGVDAEARPSKPYGAPDRDFGHEGYASISIAYNAAEVYCQWLSKKTGKKFRLLTEAEWEYACLAGQPEKTYTKAELDKIAWFADNATNEVGDLSTHPVGQKQPNAWGLFDMLGNAGEWVSTGEKMGVVKGGAFRDKVADVQPRARAIYNIKWQARDPQDPKSRWWLSDGQHVGFRVAMDE